MTGGIEQGANRKLAKAAQHANLAIIGTAGLLLFAKKAGLAPSVKPWLAALQSHSYFLSMRLVEAVLKQAGED